MVKGKDAPSGLTIRPDADLLALLDREVARLEVQTGLRLGRAATVMALLRRSLASTPAPAPLAEVEPMHPGPSVTLDLDTPTPNAPKVKRKGPKTAPKLARALKPAATDHKALVARFKQSGMSRRELADLAKVPVGSMSGWLAGRNKYDRAVDKALRAKGH